MYRIGSHFVTDWFDWCWKRSNGDPIQYARLLRIFYVKEKTC